MSSYKSGCAPTLFAGGVVAALLLLAFGWLAGGPYTEALPRLFDPVLWKAPDARDEARCAMIADLRYRIGIVGKTRAELTTLLGESENEHADSTTSHWHLCPSFADVYILEVQWRNVRAVAAWVHDT